MRFLARCRFNAVDLGGVRKVFRRCSAALRCFFGAMKHAVHMTTPLSPHTEHRHAPRVSRLQPGLSHTRFLWSGFSHLAPPGPRLYRFRAECARLPPTAGFSPPAFRHQVLAELPVPDLLLDGVDALASLVASQKLGLRHSPRLAGHDHRVRQAFRPHPLQLLVYFIFRKLCPHPPEKERICYGHLFHGIVFPSPEQPIRFVFVTMYRGNLIADIDAPHVAFVVVSRWWLLSIEEDTPVLASRLLRLVERVADRSV